MAKRHDAVVGQRSRRHPHTQSKSVPHLLFREAWSLLHKTDRGVSDDIRMMNLAQAARLHWAATGTDRHLAVAEWLIARTHAALGNGTLALQHAIASREHAQRSGLDALLVAGAFEGIARTLEHRGNVSAAGAVRRVASDSILPLGLSSTRAAWRGHGHVS